MDFGSFLRQRQQKNRGGADATDYASPQAPWNQQFAGGNQFMDDPVPYGINQDAMSHGNVNDWSSREPSSDQFYDRNVPRDVSYWERRNDDYKQHQDPSLVHSVDPDQHDGPWFPSRGRGTGPARGRSLTKRLGAYIGRQGPDIPPSFDAETSEEDWHIESSRGFGRGSHTGRLHNVPPDPESDISFGGPSKDGDNAFGSKHPVENKGHDGAAPIHCADGNPEVYSAAQEFENKDQSLKSGMQQMAYDNQTRVDKPVGRIPRKPKELPDSGRDEADQKLLADFDFTQININWAHFGVTKAMLREASEEGKNGISKKKNFDTSKLEFYCKLCDVQTVSAGNFCDHLTGRKHKGKVEFEVDSSKAVETDSTALDEQECKTYGGLVGMDELVLAVAEDSVENKEEVGSKDIKLEIDNRYEKKFYDDFDIQEYKFDWELFGITKKMLKEASMDSKEVKYEDKSCDVFLLHFYCKICDVQSTSGQAFSTHLTGRKHKNKVLRIQKECTLKNPEDGEPKENKGTNDDTEEARKTLRKFDLTKVELVWEHYGITQAMIKEANTMGIPGISHSKKIKEFDVNNLKFYCKLCAAQMVSAGNFKDHLVGKRHKHSYQEYQKFMSEATLNRNRPLMMKLEELGKKSVFEVQVTDSDRFLGLSYIIEVHSIYRVWCLCRLCGCKFPGENNAKRHVLGMKHRIMYMWMMHPSDYNALEKNFELNKPYAHILEQLCQDKYKSDGSGKSTIKRYDEAQEGDIELATQDVQCDDTERLALHLERVKRFMDWFKLEHKRVLSEFFERFVDRPPSSFLKSFKFNFETLGAESTDKSQDFDEQPFDSHEEMAHRHPGDKLQRPREGILSFPNDQPPHPMHDIHPHHRRDFPPDSHLHLGHEFPPHHLRERAPLPRHEYPPRYELYAPRSSHSPPPHYRRGRPSLGEDYPPYHDIPHDRDLYLQNPRLPPLYLDSADRLYRSHSGENPVDYIDPDPLKRVLKSKAAPTPDPVKPVHLAEPYIDPDPLKRVLPSQKAKLKPVVIDYSHGKQEKSSKSKAEEWENDLNDILGSSKVKGPDSLSLLSCSYSSPPREKSPPESKMLTKELPFSKSYLERATLKSRRSPEINIENRRSSGGSQKHDFRSRSPEQTKYRKRSPEQTKYTKSNKETTKYGKFSLENTKNRNLGPETMKKRKLSPEQTRSGKLNLENSKYKNFSSEQTKSRKLSPDKKRYKNLKLSQSHMRYRKSSPEKIKYRELSPEHMKFRRMSSQSKLPPRSSRSPPTKSPSLSGTYSPQTYEYLKGQKQHSPVTISSSSSNRSRSRSSSSDDHRHKSRSPITRLAKSEHSDQPSRNINLPGPPRSKIPLSARNVSPPRAPRSKSPLSARNINPPGAPRSKSPLSARNISPPGVPRNISPLDPPRSKSPLARSPLYAPARNKSPPIPTRSESPISRPRARIRLDQPMSTSPVPAIEVVTSKISESAGYSSMLQTSGTSSKSAINLPMTGKPAADRQSKESSPKRPLDDEDAQAEMIANMLLNMKHSIVGSEIEDPHAALQALLSSNDLAEALLASKIESAPKKVPSPMQQSESSQQPIKRNASPPQSKSTREKVAFSFQGKGPLPSRNVPQTFIDEDSESEGEK